MPIYEYECQDCSHRFERIQKFSDPFVEVCPECEGSVKRLLSPPALHFKGSGWYVTDYARNGKGAVDKGTSSSSAGGDEASSSGAASSAETGGSSDE